MQRFWDKVDATGSCWEWTASLGSTGYGQFSVGKAMRKAHRVSWELLVGPIPNGMVIDHLCKNPICVNPDHLEVVTQAENVRRGHSGSNNRVKAECPQGHPYDNDNIYWYEDRRYCRACRRERDNMRRYRQAQVPR